MQDTYAEINAALDHQEQQSNIRNRCVRLLIYPSGDTYPSENHKWVMEFWNDGHRYWCEYTSQYPLNDRDRGVFAEYKHGDASGWGDEFFDAAMIGAKVLEILRGGVPDLESFGRKVRQAVDEVSPPPAVENGF